MLPSSALIQLFFLSCLPSLYHNAVIFKELICRTLQSQLCHPKEHGSRRGQSVQTHTYVCLCVCTYLLLRILGEEEDWPFYNYHGTIRSFRWCLWSHLPTIFLFTTSHLKSSLLFSSASAQPSHLFISDHPLSMQLPGCFVTSSLTNHRVTQRDKGDRKTELKEIWWFRVD